MSVIVRIDMAQVRVALANLPYPSSPDDSVVKVVDAVAEASSAGALIVCFPECYVPGYRAPGRKIPGPDQAFLERAWQRIARAAGEARIAVVLGTERVTTAGPVLTALV